MSDDPFDIWLTRYQEITDEGFLARMHALLSDDERARQRRFHFEDDRKRYLVTRALVRTVLSRYAPVDPEAWQFAANAYGRPEVDPAHVEAEGLSFNVSHTKGLIALGVTRARALGVDVENTAVREVSLDIADRFFSPMEAAELSTVSVERRQDRFFEYWTFKESYIKARGMGLSLPLDGFSFRYPHERSVCIDINPELSDDPRRWSFWQFRPGPEYLLAICCERAHDLPSLPAIRHIVPTADDHVLDLPPLKLSARA